MSILRGRLVRSEADQIIMSVSESSEPLMQGKKRLGYNIKRYEEGEPGPELSIPKEIILSVMHKGNNRIKENTAVETVGYIMMSLGVAHLVSVPVSKALENDNRTGSMAWLGLGELLGGLIVAVLADQKEYVTADSCPGKSGANVWTIR
jgi:hypothetical protein